MFCTCGKVIEPVYQHEGKCEDCKAMDWLRWHGRSERAAIDSQRTTKPDHATKRPRL